MNQVQQIDPSKCPHPSFYYQNRPFFDDQGNSVDLRFICCRACNMAISYYPATKNVKSQKASKQFESQIEQELFKEFEEFKKNTIQDLNQTVANLSDQLKGKTSP